MTGGGLIERCSADRLASADTLLAVGQARTALADTPGSLFAAKCEALQAEQQYAELLEQLVQHFDLLFTKDPDRGTPRRRRLCRVLQQRFCFEVALRRPDAHVRATCSGRRLLRKHCVPPGAARGCHRPGCGRCGSGRCREGPHGQGAQRPLVLGDAMFLLLHS